MRRARPVRPGGLTTIVEQARLYDHARGGIQHPVRLGACACGHSLLDHLPDFGMGLPPGCIATSSCKSCACSSYEPGQRVRRRPHRDQLRLGDAPAAA